MNFSKSFSEKIKKLRTEKGLSQDELGNLINVHGRHVWKYEKGKALPQAETLIKIADVFGVTVEYLLRDNFDKDSAATFAIKDQDLIRKFQAVEKMADEDRNVVKILIDAFIKKQQIETVLDR